MPACQRGLQVAFKKPLTSLEAAGNGKVAQIHECGIGFYTNGSFIF
jgi:hypothetical protein